MTPDSVGVNEDDTLKANTANYTPSTVMEIMRMYGVVLEQRSCFDKCAKLVDAILLRASAFLFLLLGTWLMEKLSKPPTKLLIFSSTTGWLGNNLRSRCSVDQRHNELFHIGRHFSLELLYLNDYSWDGKFAAQVYLTGHSFIFWADHVPP
ncbi:hypothetical protein Tco_0772867 [Tanacetum coccineum]|uniref:Uncharacterized protein n=1 Tax=Tanacetum coccineum TaxID=301880 RepID=A0ABQ4ZKE3_9ASTR